MKTNQNFINNLEDKVKHIKKVISLAKEGKIETNVTEQYPSPGYTPQEQCYIDHAGECGVCYANGSFERCG